MRRFFKKGKLQRVVLSRSERAAICRDNINSLKSQKVDDMLKDEFMRLRVVERLAGYGVCSHESH